MKRLSIFILILFISLGCCACQRSSAETWQDQYDLGMRYLSEGNYEEAIIAFTAAIEIDAKRPEAFLGRGQAYEGAAKALIIDGNEMPQEAKELLDLALNDYLMVIDIDNSSIDAYVYAADVYIMLDDADAAVDLLQLGISRTDSQTLQQKQQEIYDSQSEEAKTYSQAEKLVQAGNNYEAASLFYQLKDYQDAWDRCIDIWTEATIRKTIAAGGQHSVAVCKDGTVVAVGANEYHPGTSNYWGNRQCEVSNWTNIVSVAAGELYTVGLMADGTAVAVGYNERGQCDVSGWTDIVAVAAGGSHTLGLRADGTVAAAGSDYSGQCDVSEWTDIVAVAAGENHSLGLRSDGTVVAVGNNERGQCDVSGWTDIVAIAAFWNHTVGLRADGTVVAVGSNDEGQCDVSGWTDIVAIAAGMYHTVGLRTDGTVAAAGSDFFGQCDVSEWTDIAAVAAGGWHTLGLRADGTAVAAHQDPGVPGSGKWYGADDVSGWTDIRLP